MKHLIAAALIALASSALADVNLVWSPSSTSNRDAGSWQRAAPETLVLLGTSALSGYSSAPIVRFDAVGASQYVFACTADIPVGQGPGCPTPGLYNQERMIPKAQAATVAPPPPPPRPDPPPPPAYSWTVPCVPIRTSISSVSPAHRAVYGFCYTDSGWRAPSFDWEISRESAENMLLGLILAVSPQSLQGLQDASDEYVTRPPVSEARAAAIAFMGRYAPRYTVRTNGSSSTRPAYLRNGDVRGAQSGTIAVGAPCERDTRIPITGDYFRVSREPDRYAQCSRQEPPAEGW